MVSLGQVREKAITAFTRLEKRQRTLVLLLIAAVLFSFYYNMVFKPQSAGLKKTRTELRAAQNQLTKLKAQVPDVAKERKEFEISTRRLETLKERLASIEKDLPGQSSVSRFLGELVHQTGGLAVDFVSIKPKTNKANKDFPELEIEVKFNAGYSDAVSYIKRLESVSPFLKVTTIGLEEMREGFRGQVAATVTLLTLLGQETSSQALSETHPAELVSPISPDRNPFVSKHRPNDKDDKVQQWRLSGIIAAGKEPTAIINDEVYRVGDKFENETITQILPNMVILTNGRENTVLALDKN